MSKRKSRNSIKSSKWIPGPNNRKDSSRFGKLKTDVINKGKENSRIKIVSVNADSQKSNAIICKSKIEFEFYNFVTQQLCIPIEYDKYNELLDLYKPVNKKKREKIKLKSIKIKGEDHTIKINKLEILLYKEKKNQKLEIDSNLLNANETKLKRKNLNDIKIIKGMKLMVNEDSSKTNDILQSKNKNNQKLEKDSTQLNSNETKSKIIKTGMRLMAVLKKLKISKQKLRTFLLKEGFDENDIKPTSKMSKEMAISINKSFFN
ncbi:MAG: hypothetical protein H0U27_12065 [Nitrosopumilus sp.]|nr:hypothetical protein [Nitrosopumilus sp.]